MKIAYIISHDITRNDGVTKKIKGQVDEWKKNGHAVMVVCHIKEKGRSILDANQYEYKNYLTLRLSKQTEMINDINEFKPDVVYLRYDTWSISLHGILKKFKVIAELNTLDLDEFWLLYKKERTIKSLLRYIAYKTMRSTVLGKVKGIVSVTNEILHHDTVKGYIKKKIVIPNGINLHDFTTIKIEVSNTKRTGLFFIGTPDQPWQGVDIIEHIANKLPEFDFHIVGVSGSSIGNIYYHGYLDKTSYVEVLKKCHVCIGTLALFRKNMTEACPLKVREYLAYGYPVVVGYLDTSYLNTPKPFLYELDSQDLNETTIHELKSFILESREYTVTPAELDDISIEATEKTRLEFFSNVMNT